jgi:prevent-host-death family protein
MEIDEAQARFSWVLELVEAGQEITLTRACRQVVRLAPYVNWRTRPRQPGLLRGRIWMADDFDSAQTNKQIAQLFEA